jgi:hypothetical protein
MSSKIESAVKYFPPSGAFFKIPEVNYLGKPHTFRLFENLTKSMNAQQLSDFYNSEKQKGNPYPANSLIIYSLMSSAVKSGNSSLLNFLKDSVRKKYPNALSKIVYFPNGNGKAVHNFGTPDEFCLYGKHLNGDEGYIKNLSNIEDILRITLGIKDVKKLNEISQGIDQTQMYLLRINSKSSEKQERLVRFNAYSDRFYLSCYRDLPDEFPAFQVLQVD